jgi:predicted HTH domain antitoxin
MTNLSSPELLEDEIGAVVRAGEYKSREDAIGHAFEVLLSANPPLRINTAVELYRQSKVTLARAAEIAGLEVETFKDCLGTHNVGITIDESPDEISAGATLIQQLRKRVC